MVDSAKIKLKEESYRNFKGINNKVSEYANTEFEVRSLENLSFQSPGAWDSRPGTTLFFGVSLGGEISGIYEYRKIFSGPPVGEVYRMASSFGETFQTLYQFRGPTFPPEVVKNDIGGRGALDFETFVDYLFVCNGNDFFKYNGNSLSLFSLPDTGFSNVVYGPNGVSVGGFSGSYTYSFSYINDRGFVGVIGGGDTSGGFPFGPVYPNIGVTGGQVVFSGFTVPPGYGITGIVVYRTNNVGGQGTPRFEIARFSGSTFVDIGYPDGIIPEPTNIWFTLAPRYMELFNNVMAYSGFSSLPSTVYLSDVGEPESIQPESFFEARTNDGDFLTGQKQYSGDLILFKRFSFHKLIGDSPETYAFQTISTEYGCLSNRAVVEFEGVLWFLDQKGIVEFNGAVPKIVSNKVEDIFLSMDLDSAVGQACALHVKSRSEVWFAIPTRNSPPVLDYQGIGRFLNDTIVVYDYYSDAWTTFKTPFPAVLSRMSAFIPQALSPTISVVNEDKKVFLGSYSGNLAYFDAPLNADYSGAFTCMVKTRFLSDLGNSVTKEFRRLYVDIEPRGVPQTFQIEMFTDYSTSASLVQSMTVSPSQTRIDFGLDGKSIQLQMSYLNATLPVKINGYTFEYRELRRV